MPPGAVHVTGDTRYDQVWQRAEKVDRSGALLASLASPRPTLVAGSTWPADEAVLFDAWMGIRRTVPEARLILAPHEPTAIHLAAAEAWAARESLRLVRLGDDGSDGADVVLVDRTGVLGDIYAIGDVAYVGGGFHSAGLHSVLEPAAFGLPVIFGPRYGNSRDATLLLGAGGGIAVSEARELCDWTRRWLAGSAEDREAGVRARAMVRSGLGAARRSFELVEGLLG